MTAPFRPCDHCDKPAVVHNTAIVKGVLHESHLCEEHASAAGIQVPQTPVIGKLIAQFTASTGTPGAQSAPGSPAARTKGPTCARCGMNYSEYRQHGVLGCGDCYEAFAATLDVVLDRAHGACQHVGKAPATVGDALQRAAVLQQLLRELDASVRAEQYERAAKLRDQIKEMRPGSGGGAAADTTPGASTQTATTPRGGDRS